MRTGLPLMSLALDVTQTVREGAITGLLQLATYRPGRSAQELRQLTAATPAPPVAGRRGTGGVGPPLRTPRPSVIGRPSCSCTASAATHRPGPSSNGG